MSIKTKVLSATAVAVALLATVAVAHTVQTRVTARAHATSPASAAVFHSAPFVRHDNFACSLASAVACEQIESLLPK